MHRVLVINPRSDQHFVARAEEAATDAATAEELQGRLRVDYPRAVVRLRQISGESDLVWYVYREGRWVPPEGATEETKT